MKEEIVSMLKSIERDGIDSLINWLENETDYFTAPASTKYHDSCEGGLIKHSLNVYDCLHEVLTTNKFLKFIQYNREARIICALLHDVCKTNFYKVSEKMLKMKKPVNGKRKIITPSKTVIFTDMVNVV